MKNSTLLSNAGPPVAKIQILNFSHWPTLVRKRAAEQVARWGRGDGDELWAGHGGRPFLRLLIAQIERRRRTRLAASSAFSGGAKLSLD